MLGDDVEFQSFHVGERLGLLQPGSIVRGGVGAGADDDIGPAE